MKTFFSDNVDIKQCSHLIKERRNMCIKNKGRSHLNTSPVYTNIGISYNYPHEMILNITLHWKNKF